MHSVCHTWDPEVVYFLWFSFVLSLLGNVSFPIMGASTLFLLRNICILYWSKITVPWLCLKHDYCARNSSAAFRTVNMGRDSFSCERHCTKFEQKKECLHNACVHTHTHSITSTFTLLTAPPPWVYLSLCTIVSSMRLPLVFWGPLISYPLYRSIITHTEVFP